MIREAQSEIHRLSRLQQSTELSLLLLPRVEEKKRAALERRRRQLAARIAWFEAVLREHGAGTE